MELPRQLDLLGRSWREIMRFLVVVSQHRPLVAASSCRIDGDVSHCSRGLASVDRTMSLVTSFGMGRIFGRAVGSPGFERGSEVNRQPPGMGMTRRRSASISSHSVSGMGWRLMARRTGSGSGAAVGGGTAGGLSRARTAVAAVDRAVRFAPHASHVRPPMIDGFADSAAPGGVHRPLRPCRPVRSLPTRVLTLLGWRDAGAAVWLADGLGLCPVGAGG